MMERPRIPSAFVRGDVHRHLFPVAIVASRVFLFSTPTAALSFPPQTGLCSTLDCVEFF
ncbi:hypothetical protein FA95DRAFT_1567481, partial [Auriscalpium vulgare]